MSLYLKTLEAKLPQGWQQEWWLDTRLLPDLDNNIRCGNSLLSREDFDRYWEEEEGALFSADEDIIFRINAFEWQSRTKGFGRVLLEEHGGFDCIIGNPPYIRAQVLNEWEPEECGFYKWNYDDVAVGSYDIYVIFIRRCLDLLTENGILGFICPHKYWQAAYGKGLRRIIADGKLIRSLIDFTDQQVFRDATTYTAIQILGKEQSQETVNYARITVLTDGEKQCRALDAEEVPEGAEQFQAPHPEGDGPWFFHPDEKREFLEALEGVGIPLFPGVCSSIFQGVVTGSDDIFLSADYTPVAGNSSLVSFYSEALGDWVQLEAAIVVPVVRREGFQSHIALANHALILPYDEDGNLYDERTMRTRFAKSFDYLGRFKDRLQEREGGKFRDSWWCLSRGQNIERWRGNKVLVPYMLNQLQAVWDDVGWFFVNVTTGGYGLEIRPSSVPLWHLYVVGLLNSRLLDYYIRNKSNHFHSGYFPANKLFIAGIPIKVPESEDELSLAKQLTDRTERIIDLKQRVALGGLGDRELERLERDVEAHQQSIDGIVCKLYNVDANSF